MKFLKILTQLISIDESTLESGVKADVGPSNGASYGKFRQILPQHHEFYIT